METTIDEPPSQVLSLIIAEHLVLFIVSGIVLLALLALSALVSGSEVAFFSLSADQLKQCEDEDEPKSKQILKLVKQPKLLLSTILILNNFVNVAFVTLSTFVTWAIAGSKHPEGTFVVILTVLVTASLIFFGEVIPKVYATQNNLTLAKLTAPLLRFGESAFRPLSWFLMSMTDVIERRFEKKGYDLSVEELSKAVELTTENEETTEEEKDILKGIVNFGTITVKQVMRSRMDITAFDADKDFHELMDKINKSGYSRVPIYRDTIDKIEGILYSKDLLPFLNESEHFKWQKLLRPGYFVPETKRISTLLKDFQNKRVHMAIVVDEYGGTSGLITLEDIIEEIVGEINDEFDEEEIPYEKLDDKTYLFEGKISLNDLCKVIEEDPAVFEKVKGESESLGGLILELNNKLPNSGESVAFDKFVFTVVAVDKKRIKKVKVHLRESIKNVNEK